MAGYVRQYLWPLPLSGGGGLSLYPPQMPKKKCRGPCEETRPLSEYRRNSRSPDGRETVCKFCRRARDRVQKLMKRYGLTPEDFTRMSARQDGKCAICRRHPRSTLEVDHCHDTGRIRGLLCGRCNRALGLLRDDPIAIARAAAYVACHKEENQRGR